MADYTATKSVHKTLVGTTVDKVTLSTETEIEILNRGATGASDIAVTYSFDGSDPPTPVLYADDTELIPPGGSITIGSGADRNGIIKIVGIGNAYSVIGVR